MDITYDPLFVTITAEYWTSSGIKLCNEHGNTKEGEREAENFRYSARMSSLWCLSRTE